MYYQCGVMEFKVIFAGFAVHCVLNLVLISKNILSRGDEATQASAVEARDLEFFKQVGAQDGKILRLEDTNGSGIMRLSD